MKAQKTVHTYDDGGPDEVIVSIIEPDDDCVVESYIVDADGSLRKLGGGSERYRAMAERAA